MKKQLKFSSLCLIFILAMFAVSFSQNQTSKPVLKSTTYKSETVQFGAGGTLTIVGAPNGSISIEGWQKNEISVEAEIETEAENEADLEQIAKVSGFVFDQGFTHTKILSVGTNDRDYLKRVAKKFPKRLLGNPFKIDYKIKVPFYCDLEINGGKGDLSLLNVEGTMLIKFLDTNAKLNLTGGSIDATFGKGNIEVMLTKPSWRGRMLNIALVSGDLSIIFPTNMNADLDANILRTGKIDNSFAALKPREKSQFSEKSVIGRAGSGGAPLTFKVGDGTLKLNNK